VRTVRQWHDDAVTEYVDATRRATKAAPLDPVTDYLEFIESCTAGNVQAMRPLSPRYSCCGLNLKPVRRENGSWLENIP
jgi:hypothetical protein